jgi:prefoldin subunit 5
MNWDPTFDPMRALEELHQNQLILQQNQTVLQQEHNRLGAKVKEMESVIDVLVKGLDAANKANELLIAQWVTKITNDTMNPNLQGQH